MVELLRASQSRQAPFDRRNHVRVLKRDSVPMGGSAGLRAQFHLAVCMLEQLRCSLAGFWGDTSSWYVTVGNASTALASSRVAFAFGGVEERMVVSSVLFRRGQLSAAPYRRTGNSPAVRHGNYMAISNILPPPPPHPLLSLPQANNPNPMQQTNPQKRISCPASFNSLSYLTS
jgi:hypothetical protein